MKIREMMAESHQRDPNIVVNELSVENVGNSVSHEGPRAREEGVPGVNEKGIYSHEGLMARGVCKGNVRVRHDGRFELGSIGELRVAPRGLDIKRGLTSLGLDGANCLYPDLKQIRYYAHCVQDIKRSIGVDNCFYSSHGYGKGLGRY